MLAQHPDCCGKVKEAGMSLWLIQKLADNGDKVSNFATRLCWGANFKHPVSRMDLECCHGIQGRQGMQCGEPDSQPKIRSSATSGDS